MVTLEKIDELILKLEELRNEIKWAERANKPVPKNCGDPPEVWKSRCDKGKRRLPTLKREVKAKIKEILSEL